MRSTTKTSSLRPAAFLDRDGVLNRDSGFVYRSEDFVWMSGAMRAIRRLNDHGYLVFVVTNQSGVGRGYYPESAVVALHRWISQTLRRVGANIDAFYYCPHHPTEGIGRYRRACPCRKPLPGMILQAMREWPVDASHSFLIGDKSIDLQAAQAAGIPGILADGANLDALVRRVLARSARFRANGSHAAMYKRRRGYRLP